MNEPQWAFWIDVGGTFTDCLARRPDGTLCRHKLLSSGLVMGAADAGSDAARIIDAARRADPPGFWQGCLLRLMGDDGRPAAEARVKAFDHLAGSLELAGRLPAAPPPGQRYELDTGAESPVLAIRYLLKLPPSAAIPPVSVRLGTTRGTNALITRRGARTALVTTRGFGDILHIGYQNRPLLFQLDIRKHPPLFAATVEIDERVTATGQVLEAPNAAIVQRQLARLRSQGIESLAICLLHGSEHPAHERLVADVARKAGFHEISESHRVAPLVRIVSRGDTTVMDAYLNPVLRAYVAGLQSALAASDLRIMTSAGGLASADRFVGKDSILSGPAGGVVGFSAAARAAGFERAIGFDMGGTSTDVARYDGRHDMEYETEKAGVRIVAPMLAIETVAAGGGSICGFDGVKLVVGPDSAGAQPGPACYGRGGPLAVTDLNYYQGKILQERFPFPLDRRAVQVRLAELAGQIEQSGSRRYDLQELCEGLLRVANASMVRAIRSISVAKGCDPRDYVLVAFGGAAPQHACAVAAELGIRHVLVHPDASILSAYGIGLADITRHRVAGLYQPYDESGRQRARDALALLAEQARREVMAEGVAAECIEIREQLDLRYRGLDAWLSVAAGPDGDYGRAYEAEHEKLYGYRHAGRPLEIVAARVEAIGRTPVYERPTEPLHPRSAHPEQTRQVYFGGLKHQAGVFDRDLLRPGDRIAGPALIHEPLSVIVVDPGWQAEVLGRGELLLAREAGADLQEPPGARGARAAQTHARQSDPVLLEIFNHQFAGIAEQMGITLRNTALSVNVKERLDFSCAVFTANGDLVVNAPHIPVHLGAMGETVKRLLADNSDLAPGDVLVTNDPFRGGSHLPDVTVVTSVHDPATGRLLFLTASRAHHAEIGGVTPGSMPPFSQSLAEEGVLIRNFKLVAAGEPRYEQLAELLAGGAYPSRAVADNLADITAQVAANRQGARDLGRLVERYGLDMVEAYMGHIQWAAERKTRSALARLRRGQHRFVDYLDDGSAIAVSIDVRGDSAAIDFTGTGPVLSGNLNANRAIVTAAVIYVLRLLIDEDIPLNQGILAPVELCLPQCLLNPPEGRTAARSAAMVGGNVETSQRVVDVLLGALGLAAASQGTMNNVVLGDNTFGYYETICGGAGATAAADGASAVHTHMTNTRLTDPEVLERRYPVRLHQFSIRRGSGGRGARRGGDGVVRRLEMLRRLEVSILSQRRGQYTPYGAAGGEAGAPGVNRLVRADGSQTTLGGLAHFTAEAGDVLIIETPGGGGFGAAGAEAHAGRPGQAASG